jgi:hypothetical protein
MPQEGVKGNESGDLAFRFWPYRAEVRAFSQQLYRNFSSGEEYRAFLRALWLSKRG